MLRPAAPGLALLLTMASAHAATFYYETDSATPAAPGTILSGGTGTGGGLCVPGTSPCPSITYGTVGTLANGLITGMALSAGPGNYLLSVGISGGLSLQSAGSIWDVTLVNGSTGVSLGTTSVVGQDGLGGGLISATEYGDGTFTIGVTDLLEQYEGQPDALPGALGFPADNSSLTSTPVSSPSSLFTLTFSVTPAPEPDSVGIFAGGLAALGALLRRRG